MSSTTALKGVVLRHRRLRVQPADAERALPSPRRTGPLAHAALSATPATAFKWAVAVGAAEDEFPQSIMLDPEQLHALRARRTSSARGSPRVRPYGQLGHGHPVPALGTYDFYIVDSALTPRSTRFGRRVLPATGPRSSG
ncbi:MAG: hypothetical protein ACLTDR_03705 [Adlercreutzia equolifaciens]